MADSRELPPPLPLQLPMSQALFAYMRTLGIFALITIVNIAAFSIFLLISPAQLIPVPPEPVTVTDFAWASSFPGYHQELFQDGFDAGLGANWAILEGDPVIREGRLSAGSGILVVQWLNDVPDEYAVSMVFSQPETPGDFVAWASNPDIRYSVSYEGSSPTSYWQTYDGVAWSNASEPAQFIQGGLLELLAANNSYAAIADGELQSIFTHPSPERGPFTLFLSQGMYLDSVTILVP